MHLTLARKVLLIPAAVWATAAFLAGPPAARGDTYTQATQATVGNITSQTVATTPANRARTTIGIGEEVDCSIDQATWADTDCNVTQGQVENDTIGTCTWSVSGAGTLSTTTGFSTRLTAHQSPGTAVVEAVVKDSQTKYNESVTKTKSFSIIAPNGETATVKQNTGLGLALGNNQIGSETIFAVTVQPTTVSFYRASLRENIPNINFTWPDGTADTFTARILPIPQDMANQYDDQFGYGPDPIGRIRQGAAFVNFTINIPVPREYRNQSGLWVVYTTVPSKSEYRGADQKSRQHFNAAAIGSWQGPWQ